MNYLVIDFEATCCDQDTVPRNEMEIIEFGCVMVDSEFHVIGEYQTFVQPVRHKVLTNFCKKLTSITQEDVDGAPKFKNVIADLKDWLAQYDDYVFCSWGDYDRKQLIQDCIYNRVQNPLQVDHYNIKQMFANEHNLKPSGLGKAINIAGLKFSGTAHRGIDDAKNIARLLPYVFGGKQIRK